MCTKCKNGLIPHPKIPNAFLDCECKQDEPLPYRQLSPADIDFPVSRDFYRFYASRNHWPDPGKMKDDTTAKQGMVQLKTVINNYNVRPSELRSKGGIKQQADTVKGLDI